MPTKTIVALANSVKKSDRCLAGKELTRVGNEWRIGQWIRPVASEDGDEIPYYPMCQALGHNPSLLEIIEIPFKAQASLDYQPENWLVELPLKKASWISRGRFDWDNISSLVDAPPELWNDPSERLRRVKEGFPSKMKIPASLYLIKPGKIEGVKVWSESNAYPGASSPTKRKRVLTISYAKQLHECDINDPVFAQKYYPHFPTVNQPELEIDLMKPKETIICVSLTGPFRGHHYKIAAAFFEPPVE